MTLRLSFYIDSVPITAGVIAGTASLGGSESACIGLMRALSARGHDVITAGSRGTRPIPSTKFLTRSTGMSLRPCGW
jgi:hypothetical protein